MNDRDVLVSQVLDMLQQANARELDLIWRFLRSMLSGRGTVG